MKKILITGANGFLGQHLTLHLKKAGFEVIATGKGECRIHDNEGISYASVELTNKEDVRQMLLKFSPDVIIHNAALSKPDECENNKNYCLDINVESTNYLLESAVSHFVYISTDFIFGENGPHPEDAEPEPLNFYGQSKLMSEKLVKQSGKKYAIVRPVFIYGQAWEGMRPSFLHWVKNNLQQQKKIKVVSDQLRTPTYANDICRGIEAIIRQQRTGQYNLAGKDVLSPYDMAVTTANVLQLDPSLIEKVTAETFPEPVRRAKRSGLTIDKAKSELNYAPVSFEEGVRLTFAD
jgi:dTDP-4-dehydrorhamnose reductase